MSADAPRFAVATFTRVPDLHPVQDALTLPELTAALARFMVKPRLQERINEDVAQIARAVQALAAGEAAPGRAGAKLEAVARDARERGLDPLAAVQERAQVFEAEVRREAKKDFRLWTPLYFRPGGRREAADVLHASCLVLDYDDDTPLERAHEVWQPWLHLIHTTWSHTAEHPKFRVVLPLARPVGPLGLLRLWSWAEDRTRFAIDPTGCGVARAYAIPVVPDARAPRRALAHLGPLLDPSAAGVVDAAPAHAVVLPDVLRPGLLRHDPEASWVEGSADGAPRLDPSRPWEDDRSDWDPRTRGAPEARGEADVLAPARTDLPERPALSAHDEVLARLDLVLTRLDALGEHALVDGLERLAALRQQGALSDEEFRTAKGRILLS